MVSLEDAINELYYVKYGDFVTDRDINTLVKALSLLLNELESRTYCSLPFTTFYVMKEDIISPEHHNKLVDAVKNAYDCIKEVLPAHPKLSELKDIIDRLRYVSVGDYVLHTDHNDLVDAVKLIYEMLVSAIVYGYWLSDRYNEHASCFLPTVAKAILCDVIYGGSYHYLYAVLDTGYIAWVTYLLNNSFSGGVIAVTMDSIYVFLGTATGSGYYAYLVGLDLDGTVRFVLYLYPIAGGEVGGIAVDSDGYIYTSGVAKVNSNGDIIWKIYICGSETMILVDDAYVYTTNWGSSSPIQVPQDVYKIDKDGNIIWKVFVKYSDYIWNMASDYYGNIYLDWFVWGVGGGVNSYDANGNLRWWIGTGRKVMYDKLCTSDDRFYLSLSDGYVYCYDIYANLIWSSKYTDGETPYLLFAEITLAIDWYDTLYVGGYAKNTVDIIDKDGYLVRTYYLGDYVNSPVVDGGLNVYIGQGLDPALYGVYNVMYLYKFDSKGNLVWKVGSSPTGGCWFPRPSLALSKIKF